MTIKGLAPSVVTEILEPLGGSRFTWSPPISPPRALSQESPWRCSQRESPRRCKAPANRQRIRQTKRDTCLPRSTAQRYDESRPIGRMPSAIQDLRSLQYRLPVAHRLDSQKI